MNVVVLGASGKAGSRILEELVRRGHSVTGVARDRSRIPGGTNVRTVEDDLSDTRRLAAILADAEVVVSAYAPPQEDTDALLGVIQREIEAVGTRRLIVVGGAGGLEVAPGVTLIDSGHLPADWLPIAKSHVRALQLLRDSAIDWTCFSPAAYFAPGVRTGKFRLGADQLITDDQGKSWISMEDYAIAIVDEIERPRHRQQRFTIGY